MAVVIKNALQNELLKVVARQIIQKSKFKLLLKHMGEIFCQFQADEEAGNHFDNFPTDEAFCSIKAPKVEVLTFTIRSKNFVLPKFIEKMTRLNVLNIIGNGVYPCRPHNLSSIASLSNLKQIRFEHVSVSSIQPIFALQNLRKLSFIMCEINNAFGTVESNYTLPNLTDLEIDRCYDLKELPSGICNLANIKKLRITNCHELDFLPRELGRMSYLETLELNCCTKLEELPESIGSLHNLSVIDICDCLSISVLSEEIGELCELKVLKMSGCRGLQDLPMSMSKLWHLEDVICDEETSYLWTNLENDLYNLKINFVEEDKKESFMRIIH